MTALGSSKAPPDASRQASPLALLLACCNETRQLFVSHIVDCAALRLACKDGRELVDGAISAPCHLTINGGWLHRVPALLHTLAARWPLRSDLLLTAKVDPTYDPHYLLLPFETAAQQCLQLPGVTEVALRVTDKSPEPGINSSSRQEIRALTYQHAALQREQARVRCEGPFDPNTGWCMGCSSCRGLGAQGGEGEGAAEAEGVQVAPVEEAELTWQISEYNKCYGKASDTWKESLRWLTPSGRFGQQLAQLFPNLQSLDLAGEVWLPPHSGVEANTPALQARWSVLLSALRPHRLPRLRSLAGPAHLLLHPGLAELTGLQHLAIRAEDELPCPVPAWLSQLPHLHTLTLEELHRFERPYDKNEFLTAGLPLHKLLPSLPPSLHLLRLRNARLRLFPVRYRTSALDVDLQLQPQMHLCVRPGGDGSRLGCRGRLVDPEDANHLVRVVVTAMASWPGAKQQQQQQQQAVGEGGGSGSGGAAAAPGSMGSSSSSSSAGGGGGGAASTTIAANTTSSSGGSRSAPVPAGGGGAGGGGAAAPALRPLARGMGNFGPDARTPLAALAGVEIEGLELQSTGPWSDAALQLMQGLAQRYPLTVRQVHLYAGNAGELASLMPALVDLLLLTEARLGRLQLFLYAVEDDAPAVVQVVLAALRRWEAARRLPERVELRGCYAKLWECLTGALATEGEGLRGVVRVWDNQGELC